MSQLDSPGFKEIGTDLIGIVIKLIYEIISYILFIL